MKKRLSYLFIVSLLLLPVTVFAEDPLVSQPDADKTAAMHNDEGIKHYKEGHWDIAIGHFKEAIAADAKFARGHYNLALALEKANKHKDATKHFKTASELAPNDKDIQDSKTLKEHIQVTKKK